MVLDIKKGVPEVGATLIIWPKHGGSNQMWKLEYQP